MRVTHQQVMKQMLSDVKKLEASSTKGFAKGQVFKAVIREVMSDGLLLELKSGELLRSNLPQGGSYELGSEYSFEVKEGGKQIVVRPFSEDAMATLETTLEELFKGSGEKVTPEKLDAAKALLSFGQPISRESVEDLIKTAKQVDTFKGLIESDLIKLEDIPPKSAVKQVLVSHYSESQTGTVENADDLQRLMQSSGDSKNSNTQTMTDLKGSLQVGETLELKESLVQSELVKAENTSEKGLSTSKELDGSQESKQGLANVVDQGSKEETANKLLELLKNVDFQKLAFHKSANLGTSIQNLAMLDKLVFGKDTIGNQLLGLIETLNDAPDKIPQELKVLLNELDGMGLKDDNKLDEILSRISENLESNVEKESGPLSEVKSQVVNIQQSIEYMRDMNENISYFQLPLQVNDELHSVDFFVKKRKNTNKSEDETTIFISLDTHHLETVQVLVEYKKQTVGIQFRLSDQIVLDKLEASQSVLDEQLEDVTKKSFDVHFRIKDKTSTNLDVIAEISSTSSATIDMKV